MYNFRPYRNRNNPGDGPPSDGWGPLGRTGCLVLVIGFVVILIIAAIIGTFRSDVSPDTTDTTNATASLEGDGRSGSRIGTPWSEEPRTLVAHAGVLLWLSVAETFESPSVEPPEPGPNGE